MIPESLLDDFEELNQNFIYAPFGKRVAAAILDFMVIVVLLMVCLIVDGLLTLVLGLVLSNFISDISVNTLYEVLEKTFSFLGVAGIFCAPSLYFIWYESSPKQGTFGKEYMGLRVVSMEYKKLTFRHAFIRAILRWVSTVFYLIGYLPALFTRKHQAFHDLLAGTLVVCKK